MVDVTSQITASSASGNEKAEAVQWLRLASLFLDKTFWQAIDSLVERKIVSNKINGVSGVYYENHVLWAQQMLDGLITGYVEAGSLP